MTTQAVQTPGFISNLDEYFQSLAKNSSSEINEYRQKSFNQFLKLGIPTLRDEEWKYTNLTPVAEHKYEIKSTTANISAESLKSFYNPQEINIVYVNGELNKNLSNFQKLPKGLKITTIIDAWKENKTLIQSALSKYKLENETAFISLNKALTANGLFIENQANNHVETVIHIIHLATSIKTPILKTPYTFIYGHKSSELTILESHLSFDDNQTYLSVPLTDIFIEENATVNYCKAQKESLKSFHIGSTRVWQERNSNLHGHSIMVGGKITRNNLDVTLNGEGCSALLNGLYSVINDQVVDNHSAVDHKEPNCVSNQLYKGILNHSSHGVFNGKIFVKPIAQLTNSYQLNKNLLLGKDCRIDTKPQLEIFADDVKCTHGATIGQLNEDEVFYLQSRCISKREAVRMLARGFANDLILTVKNRSIQERLTAIVDPTFVSL